MTDLLDLAVIPWPAAFAFGVVIVSLVLSWCSRMREAAVRPEGEEARHQVGQKSELFVKVWVSEKWGKLHMNKTCKDLGKCEKSACFRLSEASAKGIPHFAWCSNFGCPYASGNMEIDIE